MSRAWPPLAACPHAPNGSTIQPMERTHLPHPTLADAEAWRPAGFGPGRGRDIADPIVEPVWEGRRVLVHLTGAELRIVDAQGATVAGGAAPSASEGLEPAAGRETELEAIVGALRTAIRASEAILDGVLTLQATQSDEGVFPGEVEVPTAGELAAQLFFGRRQGRANHAAGRARGRAPGRTPGSAGDRLAFVAIDLLAVDGEPLLDIPLLERKRLLESVLVEGPLVRRTAYVRLPVEPWLGSWRALGFRALAYKAANSRYEPGRPNPGWAHVPIPRR